MSIRLCIYCLPVLGKFTFSPHDACENCGARRATAIYDGPKKPRNKAKPLPRMSAVELWGECSGADDAPSLGQIGRAHV